MRARRLLAGAATVGVASLVAVLPAAADPAGRISAVESSSDTVTVVFTATDLPAGATIDLDSVQLRLDGQAVEPKVEPLTESSDTITRTAVLAMDTSESLGAAGLAAAKDAARAFLQSAPTDLRVGLVTFDASASEQVAPTTDRSTVRSAIDRLSLARGTVLYDGIGVALDSVGDEGARSILVLSDGGDVSSSATLASTTELVTDSGVVLDVVALGNSARFRPALEELASASGGEVYDVTNAEALAGEFASAAQNLAKQVVITAEVPERLAGRGVNVEVRATAGGAEVSDTTFNTLSGVTSSTDPLPAPKSGFMVGDDLLLVGIVALFIGLAGLFAFAAVKAGTKEGRSSTFRRRLSIYTLTGRAPVKQQETTSALGSSQVARSAVEMAGRVIKRRDFETVLAQKLDAAGLPLKPAEWVLIHVGAAIGLGLLLLLISGGDLLPALLGLTVGFVGPTLYLSHKEKVRRRAFLSQLPDTLTLMAGSLAAGYSLPQAIDTVVREGQQPVAGEFSRALVEARLGVPAEEALDGVATRMKSKDFEWVVMAIKIQREVGGNLAELLRTVADTLREREFLRRHVRALSAEGRLSAWILGALPPAFALYLAFVRPEYLAPLYQEFFGWVMIGTGVFLLLIGVFWMSKIVKVEV